MEHRKIEKLEGGKNYEFEWWREIEMKDLKIGDKFRMFEPPDFQEPVVNANNGTTEWTVKSEPRFDGNVWGCEIEELK